MSETVTAGHPPAPPTQAGSALAVPVSTARTMLLAAAIVALATIALTVVTAAAVFRASTAGSWAIGLTLLALLPVLASLFTIWPFTQGVRQHRLCRTAQASHDLVDFRLYRSRASNSSWITMGICLPIILVCLFVLLLVANDHAVQVTFFDVSFMSTTFTTIVKAFGKNIAIAVIAEVLVLVFGLVLAIGRMAPGTAGRPIRWLATLYVDAFRAIPGIIVIYLIGFGLPLANIPVLSDLGVFWSAILALALTYSAYVAEVFRAGIQSIHQSQTAASRSLGLSYGKTMRFVVVPQAVKRVLPPLLNDFIGLQKDTALVTIIGVVDAFSQATIYSSNYFNLSSVTLVAVLFIIVTIPQTRFVDRLIEKDQSTMKARG